MVSINDGWVKGTIAGVGALAVMLLLDWIIPGGPVLSSMLNLSWEKIKYIGIGLVILVVVIIWMIGHGISRSENTWRFNDFRKRYTRTIWNNFIDRFNRILNTLPYFEKTWIKRRLATDYLPEILEENVEILFSLSNYLKRLYITYAKMGQVTKAGQVADQMWTQIGEHIDIKKLQNEIYLCRNKGKLGNVDVGWFDSYREICGNINEIVKFLKTYRQWLADGNKRKLDTDGPTTAGNFARDLTAKLGALGTRLNALDEREKAFGAHFPIKAWNYLAFDQDNPYGQFYHSYKFFKHRGSWKEINLYGEVLETVYRNTKSFFEPWKNFPQYNPIIFRDFDKVYDIYNIDPNVSPRKVFNWMLLNWEGVIRDLRFGEFKPWSKTVTAYVDALTVRENNPHLLGKTNFYIESNIPFHYGFKGSGNPAFDRRALIDPGRFGPATYVGKKVYNESWQDIKRYDKFKETNHYPALSSLGMSMYLPALVERDVDDIQEAQRYLMPFLRDTGATVSGSADAYKLFASLGEKHEQGQQPHR
ncbi:MAG TPA: hypothetical protein VJJ52_01205 [Candidatus Nanoarchaeia archaeon]|nr:hypothetical protein [Candidatus Nanoarchaeia archaeon]